MKSNKLELVAPAGNLAKLETAFLYGADAVYLGLPDFSLRTRINSFDLKGIKLVLIKARGLKKKVYITVNIFAHNKHLPPLLKFLKAIKNNPPDAFIASDPGVISILQNELPQVPIHLSTQANCTNLASARFWYQQGVKRVVLARELSLAEIKQIKTSLPNLELEYFAHGAMCMAYSGRCFLSQLFTGRSANLGDCAQPCRWSYDLSRYQLKARGHDETLELVEEKEGSYLLNSKDLCLLSDLDKLAQAGVTSFKIEGRAKSVYYLGVVVAIYRQVLNLIEKKIKKEALEKELAYYLKELNKKLVHRGYTKGFLYPDAKGEQSIAQAKVASNYEFCGQVLSPLELTKSLQAKLPLGAIPIRVHNTIRAGKTLELILPGYLLLKLRPTKLYRLDNDLALTKVHGGGGSPVVYLKLKNNKTIPAGTLLCQKKDTITQRDNKKIKR